MELKQFSWASGAQFPVSAELAANTIENLQHKLGKDSVTANELLDASRNADAPLHCCFEWDDSIAAENFRVSQARSIINSIKVTIIKDNTPKSTVRYFLNVKPVAPKVHGEFVNVDTVFANPDYRCQVLKNALAELQNFQRKYSNYKELSGVFDAINVFANNFN